MKESIQPPPHTTQVSPVPADARSDERVWQAWKQKNERRDRMRFTRRLRVVAILVVLVALFLLIRGLSSR